jgi:flagellar assembly protein FliH
LEKIENFLSKANHQFQEIKNILLRFDNDIPELVIKFVKEIIGAERKINDEIIIEIVKTHLNRFNDLEDLTFVINPTDEEIFHKNFQFYKIEKDNSIPKGGIIVKTKIGEVELSIDKLLEDFENLIHEKLGIS